MGIVIETSNAYRGISNQGQDVVHVLESEGKITSIQAQYNDQLCVVYETLRSDFTCATDDLKKLGLYIKGFKHYADKTNIWFGQL